MTISNRAVLALAASLLAAGALLTACAPELTPADPTPTSPSPSPTSTTTSSPEPAPSATAPSGAQPYAPFTAAELTQICIDATRSTFADDIEFESVDVRIEERTVEPRWLVLVPARTGGIDAEAQCTVGGTPSEPVIEMSSGSIERLSEEQIQNLIDGENEGGTE
ncbi:hypothetical protein [Microbacterium hydrocarbonoxydans]|uniref:Uncharacterized protein n=1 Tax=Microbacterium hydrocarbonoxydans TaxID=273678 RepID=A0A1H4LPT4_9MICO|nr:hypothetical protein [Microbacterium hydrocarbonoxydans]SEB72740.1 hypothetical protein SAMN04489807_1868 [Microbacterium hydrocarbonoxydans]